MNKTEYLYDIEQIRKLKHRYCALCDDHYNAPEIAKLFTHDGLWDAGEEFGRYQGRENIEEFFSGMKKQVDFSAHLVLNDQIEIEETKATANWRSIIPTTFYTSEGKKTPYWIFGEYNDILEKVDGQWLFRSMTTTIHKMGPHLEGWP